MPVAIRGCPLTAATAAPPSQATRAGATRCRTRTADRPFLRTIAALPRPYRRYWRARSRTVRRTCQ